MKKTKWILTAIILTACLCANIFALTYQTVSGKVTGVWSNPSSGDWSIYVALNNGAASYYNGSASTSIVLKDGNNNPAGEFCIIIPNNNGSSKNALAIVLTAKATGANIGINYNTGTVNYSNMINGVTNPTLGAFDITVNQ